jgi:hypothetical protein
LGTAISGHPVPPCSAGLRPDTASSLMVPTHQLHATTNQGCFMCDAVVRGTAVSLNTIFRPLCCCTVLLHRLAHPPEELYYNGML